MDMDTWIAGVAVHWWFVLSDFVIPRPGQFNVLLLTVPHGHSAACSLIHSAVDKSAAADLDTLGIGPLTGQILT